MGERADEKGLFKRGARWWLRIYIKGHGKAVIALKPPGETHATTNKEMARALAREIRRQSQESGRVEQLAACADVGALIDVFKQTNAAEGSPAQAIRNATEVRAFIDAMDIRSPSQITVEAVQAYFVKLAQAGRSPKTRWNHRAAISRFCEFLIDREQLIANPCRRVRVGKVAKLPPRFLSAEDYDRALKLAKEHGIYAEFATALYSGMRVGEIRRMKWSDVDFEQGLIMVPKSKNARFRTIPMSEKLQAVLLELKATGVQAVHVFPGRDYRDFSGAHASGMRRGSWWGEALKPLQDALPVFTAGTSERATGRAWHLLRHTFASRLVQAGVPIAKVSAWLGHSSITTTMIYAHLAPGHDKDIEKA
jgi:integrase